MALFLLAATIGILGVGWVYVAVGWTALHLVAWAGVVSWAVHYAAGGGRIGFLKALVTTLVGAAWGFIALALHAQLGAESTLLLAVLIGSAAAGMVLQSKIPLLDFVPGAFLGAATWVGAGGGASVTAQGSMILVSLVLGAGLGFLSEYVGKRLGEYSTTAQ
jgi:hypothetical protein